MGFRNNAYATIFEEASVVTNGIVRRKISISKKNKETNRWETEFNHWVSFIGNAAKQVMSLPAKTRIKLEEVDVSEYKSKDSDEYIPGYKVFKFSLANKTGAGNTDNGQGRANVDYSKAHIPADKNRMYDFNGNKMENEFDDAFSESDLPF